MSTVLVFTIGDIIGLALLGLFLLFVGGLILWVKVDEWIAKYIVRSRR